MGFADLGITKIAKDYNLSGEVVVLFCNQFGVAYKNAQTRLALEDTKAIISEILTQKPYSGSKQEIASCLDGLGGTVSGRFPP
jgi:hypothetical protein